MPKNFIEIKKDLIDKIALCICNVCEMCSGEKTFADRCCNLEDPRTCEIAQETAKDIAKIIETEIIGK